ncbi:MAG: ThiF family adenylyltransferase [Bifidobacterium sp.]
MTFEPSASQAQIDARQHAFDNQPDPTTLVSREEIRAALLDRHPATQDKLDAAHAICGCGGLGSTIAVALTRIGVGHLHLIDFDRVDMTNLNRQQIF